MPNWIWIRIQFLFKIKNLRSILIHINAFWKSFLNFIGSGERIYGWSVTSDARLLRRNPVGRILEFLVDFKPVDRRNWWISRLPRRPNSPTPTTTKSLGHFSGGGKPRTHRRRAMASNQKLVFFYYEQAGFMDWPNDILYKFSFSSLERYMFNISRSMTI